MPKEESKEKNSDNEDEEEELKPVKKTPDQVEMLNKLTGMPTEKDTILTALPMCAPYNMMVNHKFKCKL